MRRFLFPFFLFALSAIVASSQTPSPSTGADDSLPPSAETPYIYHVTTREVLVDVIAVDSRNKS